jgi:hypothetical protein
MAATNDTVLALKEIWQWAGEIYSLLGSRNKQSKAE